MSKTINSNKLLEERVNNTSYLPPWPDSLDNVTGLNEDEADAWFCYLWKNKQFMSCSHVSCDFSTNESNKDNRYILNDISTFLMEEGYLVFYISRSYSVLLGTDTVVKIMKGNGDYIRVEAVFGVSSDFPNLLRRLYSKFLSEYNIAVPKNSAYLLTSPNGRLEITSVPGIKGCDLQRDNYEQGILKGYKKIVESVESDEPRGRLNLLTGPPGTGKTHLVKALMQDTNAALVFIPPNMTDGLVGPSLITCLLQHRHLSDKMILVFEDADSVIKPRADGNMDFISALLNITAGVVADALNIHVICTSNIDASEVDPALTRSGRLNQHLKLGKLSCDQATKAYATMAKTAGFEEMLIYEDTLLSDVYSLFFSAKDEA